jgi:hypothetical protein
MDMARRLNGGFLSWRTYARTCNASVLWQLNQYLVAKRFSAAASLIIDWETNQPEAQVINLVRS